MSRCDYCGSMILIGGRAAEALRFCSDGCAAQAPFVVASQGVPEADLEREAWAVRQGVCPKCQGPGPVDVHTSYRVWSALLFTTWASRPSVVCRGCGTRNKLGDILFSLGLGWWGFPWGLIMTPIQVGRNLVGLFVPSAQSGPSNALRRLVRVSMAAQAIGARLSA